MGIWNKTFEAVKSKKHTFIELTEEMWNDIYSNDWQSYVFNGRRCVAVTQDGKKAFWIVASEVQHTIKTADFTGMVLAEIGDYLELTNCPKGYNGDLVYWERKKFAENFMII